MYNYSKTEYLNRFNNAQEAFNHIRINERNRDRQGIGKQGNREHQEPQHQPEPGSPTGKGKPFPGRDGKEDEDIPVVRLQARKRKQRPDKNR